MHSSILDELYETYRRAFRALQAEARQPGVSILSVALEVERLEANCPVEMRRAIPLALVDALGCLPLKSHVHLRRMLEWQDDLPDPADRH